MELVLVFYRNDIISFKTKSLKPFIGNKLKLTNLVKESQELKNIEKVFDDLFPINRSITGEGLRQTLKYIKRNFFPEAEIKSVNSGQKVFDWEVPDEWIIKDAYVKNVYGKKIIDFKKNNLHLVSYSSPINKILTKEELLSHIHTLDAHPEWIPYRTTYYKKNWGFCCAKELLSSKEFEGPFEVVIESSFNNAGKLNWLEFTKIGESKKEILISTYCCHPSMANDNLSGIVLGIFLFDYLLKLKTKYTYRLLIAPETIGAISFLSQANTNNFIGGMVLSCVAGPDQISIKEGFDKNHWINKAAHLAIKKIIGDNYITYPFIPDGSDERQFSSPGLRIVTPSIHKSKYYEYEEYHTSADNLNYISSKSLLETLNVYKEWINLIETYCYPKRKNLECEFQLGKRNLYPSLGGSINQSAYLENFNGSKQRSFDLNQNINLTDAHLKAFSWLMHLADGQNSNFEISDKSGIDILIINESIAAMYQNQLLNLK